MRVITLTSHGNLRDRMRELFDYDPATGIFTRTVTVSSNAMVGQKVGCPSRGGYLRVRIDGKHHYCHRLAWLYCYGHFPEEDIDHINGNRSDNRIANLRLATRAENQQNISRIGHGKSGLVGAYWDRSRRRWYSKVRDPETGKQYRLGYYDAREDAHEAYKAWKRKNHQFAPELRDA